MDEIKSKTCVLDGAEQEPYSSLTHLSVGDKYRNAEESQRRMSDEVQR